jgi:hypothetical protein
MAKYNKKIVEKICDLIKSDSYTVSEICQIVGLSKDTYYRWIKEKSDFSDTIKKAEDEFRKDTLVECEKSLVKLIKGYTTQEKKTITVDSGKKDVNGRPIPKIKEQTIVDKHIQPNLGAIIHFQTNQDSDNWKNKHSTEVTGKDGKDLFGQLSDTELDARIAELERKLGKGK